MAESKGRGKRWSTPDVSRVVFLLDEGFLPVEWEITGQGRSRRATALYDNTPELQAALDRYFDTDNCCRVYYERCRKTLFQMQNAADVGDVRCIDLQPMR